MKKFIIAAVAANVLATPVLAAPGDYGNHGRYEQNDRGRNDRRVQIDRHVVVTKQVRPQYRSWNRGDRFDQRYARNYRVIQTPRSYRLHDAPRGYRWVQSGNDAVLIGITSGIIASVIANAVR